MRFATLKPSSVCYGMVSSMLVMKWRSCPSVLMLCTAYSIRLLNICLTSPHTFSMLLNRQEYAGMNVTSKFSARKSLFALALWAPALSSTRIGRLTPSFRLRSTCCMNARNCVELVESPIMNYESFKQFPIAPISHCVNSKCTQGNKAVSWFESITITYRRWSGPRSASSRLQYPRGCSCRTTSC